MEKYAIADKLKMGFMLAYFLILTVERVISLFVFFTGEFKGYSPLDWYMAALTIFAVFGAYVFMVMKCNMTVKRFESGKTSAAPTLSDDNFSKLAIAAGILLLGGMVHTYGTIPGIQFASYGMILASMAVHTAQCVKESSGGVRRWLSFAYIVAFSMAIPVVYHTEIMLKYLFIPIECAVSAGMVVLFTIMLKRFYLDKSENGFTLVPFLTALIGDFAVLILRWEEEINFFVLIFICVTLALWFAGNIVCIAEKKKQPPSEGE